MCDTFAVMPNSANNSKLWFAKNSDRSPNEPNLLINNPAADNDLTASPNVALTYISIPQVAHTYGVFMVKPSWTWGCEIGFNEHGVVIGNEAVFTKGGYPEKGLIGMDICRLALERCKTAAESMKMIGALIEQYGQGGNCGFDSQFFYDNSFLVADNAEAYVVETAGNLWVAKQIDTFYAISNALSIQDDWHYGSASLRDKKGKLNFAEKYTNGMRTHFSGATMRRYVVYQNLIEDAKGEAVKTVVSIFMGQSFDKRGEARGIDYSTCKRILRAHKEGGKPTESPCMHYGGKVGSHTTGSLVTCLEDSKIFVTGGSTPCRAIFKPFSLRGDLPYGNDEREAEIYWMRRELIQRNLLADVINVEDYLEHMDSIERELDAIANGFTAANATDLNRRIFETENMFVDRYFDKCTRELSQLAPVRGSAGYRKRWQEKNQILLERLKELGI